MRIFNYKYCVYKLGAPWYPQSRVISPIIVDNSSPQTYSYPHIDRNDLIYMQILNSSQSDSSLVITLLA